MKTEKAQKLRTGKEDLECIFHEKKTFLELVKALFRKLLK